MVATAVTLTKANQEGVSPAVLVAADTAEGNSIPNRPGVMLVLNNTDASPHDVTFTTPGTVAGHAVADHTVSVPAGATLHFASFPRSAFGDTVEFTSASALVEVGAYAVS